MSIKVSARLPEDVYSKIDAFEGKTFSEKLVNALSDKKTLSDNIEVSDNKKEVSDSINLDKEQIKFLCAFIDLNMGYYAKWHACNDVNGDNKVLWYLKKILLNLGYTHYPSCENIDNVIFDDIKLLLKEDAIALYLRD